MEEIELLSPAKNKATAIKAILTGADAIYIGAESFGARKSASNNIEDIEDVISFAHLFNVRVYVTINTILYDEELKQVEKLINDLYKIKVDAIIIQDFGILELNLPPITMHSSTQMTNVSEEKIKFLENIGIKRVVLERGLSIEEIIKIHNKAPKMELESFIYGALCVGVSGQCYLSENINNRSGNRGDCAQPCRGRYSLINSKKEVLVKDKFLLSTKDLNLCNEIPQLLSAGVRSFKIEGRMKDENYVSNVTAFFNEKINDFINKEENKSLYKRASIGRITTNFTPNVSKTFNRGFTTFNFYGEKDDICSFNSAKSVGVFLGKAIIEKEKTKRKYIQIKTEKEISLSDGLFFLDNRGYEQGFLVNKVEKLNDNLVKIYPNKEINLPNNKDIYRNFDKKFNDTLQNNSSQRRIGLDISIFSFDKGFYLILKDEDSLEVKTEILCQKVLSNKDNKALLEKQLTKLGDTIFYLREYKNNLEENYFLSISQINALRRKAIENLLLLRIKNYTIKENPIIKNNIPYYKTSLTKQDNIKNEKAREFFLRHKVEEFKEEEDNILLKSKHCIRKTLNQCLKTDNIQEKFQAPLFIKDNNHTYCLEFDCKNCLMIVKKGLE